MHTDSAYVIGASHEVCQDYARAVVRNGRALAVVSDGCSSSPDTDIGARLCVLSRLLPGNTDVDRWLPAANGRCIGLNLPTATLDATLAVVDVCQDWVEVCVHGDGYVVARNRARTDLIAIQYPDGFPAYPVYMLDAARTEVFHKRSAGRQIVRYHRLATPTWEAQAEEPPFINRFPGTPSFQLGFAALQVDLVAVLTDGFGSFRRPGPTGPEPVPITEVIDRLFQFKLYSGLFVKRRLKRFLKDVKAEGWVHDDDLGIAAIYLGD